MQSPRPPAVAAVRPPAVAPAASPAAIARVQSAPEKPATGQKVARWEDEPASGGWDAAETVTSFPEPTDLPGPTPPNVPSPGLGGPPPAPVPAAGAPVAAATSPRAGTATNAIAAAGGLGSAMREEVWAIVRAAVEEAMGPLVARQRELEARVERAERLERERDVERAKAGRTAPNAPPQLPAQVGAASAASRLASIGPASAMSSIPVSLSPSLSPPAFKPPQAGVPRFDNASATDPGGVTIRDLPVTHPHDAGSAHAHPVAARPSVGPQGYGVTVTKSMRPSLDLESVGPVDIEGFDGGRRKRRVAGAVVVIMLLLVVSAVTMTVLSHS